MKALRLVAPETTELCERPDPPPPGNGEAQVEIAYLALNHLDVFSDRGMAFARRSLPLTVGAEASGVVRAVGPGVAPGWIGRRVAVYPGLVCGACRPCREGRENLCETPSGIMGFHLDGLAQERVTVPIAQLIPVPDGVSLRDAACAPLTGGTVEHMLFANAGLSAGEQVLVHAGGSGIGSTAVRLAKAAGATVIATVGSAAKMARAREIGADHVINYTEDRFERVVRALTGKRGVDVVFEHVGPATWRQSLFSLRRGGRLVTCGSTTGAVAETNLQHLFNSQIRIFASFGGTYADVGRFLGKVERGEAHPVIDEVIGFDGYRQAIRRLAERAVFGKILLAVSGAEA